MLLVKDRRGGDIHNVRVYNRDARGMFKGHSRKCFPRYKILGSVERLYLSDSKLYSLTF